MNEVDLSADKGKRSVAFKKPFNFHRESIYQPRVEEILKSNNLCIVDTSRVDMYSPEIHSIRGSIRVSLHDSPKRGPLEHTVSGVPQILYNEEGIAY